MPQIPIDLATAGDLTRAVNALATFYGYAAQVPQIDGNGKPVLDNHNNVVMVANPLTKAQFVKAQLAAELAQRVVQVEAQLAAQAAVNGVGPAPAIS